MTFAEGCGLSPCLFRGSTRGLGLGWGIQRFGPGNPRNALWASDKVWNLTLVSREFSCLSWCYGSSPAQHQSWISATWPTESKRLVFVAPYSWFFHALLLFNNTFSLFPQDSSTFLLSPCHLRMGWGPGQEPFHIQVELTYWVLTTLCAFLWRPNSKAEGRDPFEWVSAIRKRDCGCFWEMSVEVGCATGS